MSFIAVAVIGSSLIGSDASRSAGNTQADAQREAAATQQRMFDTINKQEQPFIQGGYGANAKLQDLLGLSDNKSAEGYGSLTKNFTPQDFLNNLDPGYEFQREQGAQALRNASTPGVGALSGAALKDLMSFNQGMASTGYSNAFNRFQSQQNNIFARLSGIAGLGQNAASQVGTAGTSLGTGIGQAQAAAGASLAGGIVGGANAISGGISNLGGLAFLNSGGSNVPQSAISAANGTSDPLGSLIGSQGWSPGPGG